MTGASSIFGFIPSVWPVVQRELRARARKPRYYWTRVVGGIAAMFIVYQALQRGESPSEASAAFGNLALLILILIGVTVPIMTSDCLSREKREGTLGLLFLTPLTPAGIVIGKCSAQALLAWSAWLSVLPAMAIPFLLGGLTWDQMLIAAVYQICALLVSLASGLLASSLTKRRNLAFFYAAVLTTCFASTILVSTSLAAEAWHYAAEDDSWFLAITRTCNRFSNQGLLTSISENYSEVSFLMTVTAFLSSPMASVLNFMLIGTFCATVCVFGGAIWYAARHIRRTWCDRPASARQRWWNQRFCTVLFRNSFRKRMQRSLDANPIVWLQQYSLKARFTKWGLCLLFLIIELWSLPSDSSDLDSMVSLQTPLLLCLIVAGTVVGVGSFRSEKETGALELILISPLSVKELIFGRVIGWWKQFLPAALLIFFFALIAEWRVAPEYYRTFDPTDILWLAGFFSIAYLSLPFFAVYAALRVKNFFMALAMTWVGLALAFVFGISLAYAVTDYDFSSDGFHAALLFIGTLVSSAAFVRLTFFLLRHSLSRRIYSF